ncbi:MAG: hypothetical protein ACREP6_14500 [Candidatus Binataceae bacterium]
MNCKTERAFFRKRPGGQRLFANPLWISGLFAILLMLAAVPAARALTYTVDRAAGSQLTAYLRAHRLPLVGAAVSRAADGATQVMLYGYVATQSGKRNAAKRVAKYFHNNSRLVVINRISVNPEIRKLARNRGGGETGTSAAPPSANSYTATPAGSSVSGETWEQVYQAIQRAGVHPAPDPGGAPGSAW